MSAAYVRGAYQVPAKRGMRVRVNGSRGTIVSFPDQYIGVRFDGERRTVLCHPAWLVQYEPDESSDQTVHAVGCNICGEAIPDAEPHICKSVSSRTSSGSGTGGNL